MTTATEERTALANQDEEEAGEEAQDQGDGGGEGESGKTEEREYGEPEIVDVMAQNIKVTGQTGKVVVQFEVESAASGVGVGTLMRIAVVGSAQVAIRSTQTELPL